MTQHHIRHEMTYGNVQTLQGVSESLTAWIERHEAALDQEDTSGPDPATENVLCSSWESGGVTVKVTSPSSAGVAAHREAVDAAMAVFPKDV